MTSRAFAPFPAYRPRRLRQSAALRRLVRETTFSVDNLVLPLFARAGKKVRLPVGSMPGVFQLSVDELAREALNAHGLGVPAVLLFGIPDAKWGELVTACVVVKPGQALSADELIAHCRRFLAHYKIPRRVEFSETELPKSGSGKLLKRILRERFWVDQERAVA